MQGCGYKPTSYYAKQEILENVFVNVKINLNNIDTSALLKNEMLEIIFNKFGRQIVFDKNKADTILNITLSNVAISEVKYDSLGYADKYRATVNIKLDYSVDGKKRNMSFSDFSDFFVHENNIITQNRQEESIKIATLKALREVLSKISIQAFRE